MINASTILGALGAMAAIVNIIVELTKAIIPKKIPTQLVTLIVSLIVCIAFIFIFYEIGIKTIIFGIFMSPVVAFISMNGYDTFQNLWKRFLPNKEDDE